ncbi:hypothetical protein LINPERPRIM_LOCUS26265 [Linum perenne]
MWHLLFGAAAAAVVGSTGLAAKRLLLKHNATAVVAAETQGFQEISPSVETPNCTCDESGGGGGSNWKQEDVFRFSSSGSSGKQSRRLRKKLGISGRRLRYGGSDGESKVQKESGELEVSERRRAGVCLKKRRTAKTVSNKSGSSGSSLKDSSLFGWGLGVGIMCMMSAGQVEINKLSTAMEETSKVVNELKSELDKKKFTQVATCRQLNGEPVDNSSRTGVSGTSDTKSSGRSMVEDAECPSSVLTGDHDMGMLEMYHLEAELESELRKLPVTANANVNFPKAKISSSSGRINKLSEHTDTSSQSQGVVPSELDKKLCHVLIQQQGSQIVELESELYFAQEKLQEKEAELRALKDCVKRLTEFSLSNVSGTSSSSNPAPLCPFSSF